jgi:protein involved in polysaccharide export with SLBB domain
LDRVGNSNWAGRLLLACVVSLASAVGLSLMSGCETEQDSAWNRTLDQVGEVNSFLNPSEPTLRPKRSAPLIRPILSRLDPSVDEPNDLFPTATDIEPDDMKVEEGDYKIGVNDLINIEIYDLLGEGTGATAKSVRVSESGYINLDFIKPVYSVGLTEQQLQDTIKQAYSDANVIRNARVTVTVAEQRARTFAAAGNVGEEGNQYAILQNDFRMLDALIMCKGPAEQEGVDYVYVIRKPPAVPPPPPPTTAPSTEPSPMDTTPAVPVPPTTELLEPPHSEANPDNSPASVRLLSTSGEGGDSTTPSDQSADSGGLSGFKFNAPNPVEARIIRVPLRELLNGQLQYNIVIRPGDTIYIPQPPTGEYYMGGHVARPGPYSLTARNITLKEAVISAGGFDQVAIPGRCEVIRRIGQDREVVVRLDLDAVMSMTQPDLYLKPYDEVMVGTNVWAPFLADFRNAFSITYGLGFTYDRNYSPQNNGTAF